MQLINGLTPVLKAGSSGTFRICNNILGILSNWAVKIAFSREDNLTNH